MKKNVILGLATVGTGLSAGLFFCFSVAINPGLGKLADASYILAMQNINELIQNPVFFLAFFGPVFLLPIAAIKAKGASPLRYKLLLLASVFYILGTVGVTMAKNVPMNDKLATLPVASSSEADIAKARGDYEKPWLAWHAVRAVSGVVALSFVSAACLVPETSKVKRAKENA